MNARTVWAIIIAVAVLALSIGEEIFLTSTFNEFQARLEAVDVAEPLVYDEFIEIEAWWKKRHTYLETVLPHSQINEITYTFGELIGAIIAEDQPSALAQFRRLKSSVDAISEMFGFRLGNIL